MPEGAIYVGRPSRWGNPFVVAGDALLAVFVYRAWVMREVEEFLTIDLAPLRGHDLACWCPWCGDCEYCYDEGPHDWD